MVGADTGAGAGTGAGTCVGAGAAGLFQLKEVGCKAELCKVSCTWASVAVLHFQLAMMHHTFVVLHIKAASVLTACLIYTLAIQGSKDKQKERRRFLLLG